MIAVFQIKKTIKPEGLKANKTELGKCERKEIKKYLKLLNEFTCEMYSFFEIE